MRDLKDRLAELHNREFAEAKYRELGDIDKRLYEDIMMASEDSLLAQGASAA